MCVDQPFAPAALFRSDVFVISVAVLWERSRDRQPARHTRPSRPPPPPRRASCLRLPPRLPRPPASPAAPRASPPLHARPRASLASAHPPPRAPRRSRARPHTKAHTTTQTKGNAARACGWARAPYRPPPPRARGRGARAPWPWEGSRAGHCGPRDSGPRSPAGTRGPSFRLRPRFSPPPGRDHRLGLTAAGAAGRAAFFEPFPELGLNREGLASARTPGGRSGSVFQAVRVYSRRSGRVSPPAGVFPLQGLRAELGKLTRTVCDGARRWQSGSPSPSPSPCPRLLPRTSICVFGTPCEDGRGPVWPVLLSPRLAAPLFGA